MNQEAWDSLNTKIAERDELQTQSDQLQEQLSQLRSEIDDLAGSLQDELAEYRAAKAASTTSTPTTIGLH